MHHPVGTLCGKGRLFQAKVASEHPGVKALRIRKSTTQLHRRISQTLRTAKATGQQESAVHCSLEIAKRTRSVDECVMALKKGFTLSAGPSFPP